MKFGSCHYRAIVKIFSDGQTGCWTLIFVTSITPSSEPTKVASVAIEIGVTASAEGFTFTIEYFWLS